MAPEKTPVTMPAIPLMPLVLAIILLVAYVAIVMVPAFLKAGGIPGDIISLSWPPVLMVGGFCALLWGRHLMAKNTAASR